MHGNAVCIARRGLHCQRIVGKTLNTQNIEVSHKCGRICVLHNFSFGQAQWVAKVKREFISPTLPPAQYGFVCCGLSTACMAVVASLPC